jgi:acetyl-CoA carboxylase biotin carboxyl carrier protein
LRKNLSKKRIGANKVEIDLEEVKDLIRILRENNVNEFEYSKGDYHVRIKHGALVEPIPLGNAAAAAVTSHGAEKVVSAVPAQKGEPPVAAGEQLLEVRSPMVGTFFRSSNPGSGAFVEVGDIVRKNQVLCIVEAMKIMNEIESDVEGELVKVHVSNGQPVEFGEMLFSVRPIT